MTEEVKKEEVTIKYKIDPGVYTIDLENGAKFSVPHGTTVEIANKILDVFKQIIAEANKPNEVKEEAPVELDTIDETKSPVDAVPDEQRN